MEANPLNEEAKLFIQYLNENKLTNEEALEILKVAQRYFENQITQKQLDKPCKQIKLFEE